VFRTGQKYSLHILLTFDLTTKGSQQGHQLAVGLKVDLDCFYKLCKRSSKAEQKRREDRRITQDYFFDEK
jgi:hypothetical protein